jgi:hypothetical protein
MGLALSQLSAEEAQDEMLVRARELGIYISFSLSILFTSTQL